MEVIDNAVIVSLISKLTILNGVLLTEKSQFSGISTLRLDATSILEVSVVNVNFLQANIYLLA